MGTALAPRDEASGFDSTELARCWRERSLRSEPSTLPWRRGTRRQGSTAPSLRGVGVSSERGRRPTLDTVALEVGVSRATVSNAYNRPDQLSPQLRDRIIATARRLGYPGPDPIARSLATQRAGAVALLLGQGLSSAF